MTRHGQPDLMAAHRTRWSAIQCGLGTGMEGTTPEIIGKIDTTARQIRSIIGLIGQLCHQTGVAPDGRKIAPKHKSP